MDADREGIGLLIQPWARVENLRLVLRDAIAEVWGTDYVPEKPDQFRPHVTVAYSNANADTTQLRQRLIPLRDLPPVQVLISEAHLIRLNRDDKVYRWVTEARVRLGL